jgi:hypothetical protein
MHASGAIAFGNAIAFGDISTFGLVRNDHPKFQPVQLGPATLPQVMRMHQHASKLGIETLFPVNHLRTCGRMSG